METNYLDTGKVNKVNTDSQPITLGNMLPQLESSVIGSQEQKNALIKAMVAVQKDMKNMKKSGNNSYLGYDYSTLEDVWEVLRPLASKNDLLVMQIPSEGSIITEVHHAEGGFILAETKTSMDVKDFHALGSSFTYMKRYALCALFGISSGEVDDDASDLVDNQKKAKDALIKNTEKKIKTIKATDDPIEIKKKINAFSGLDEGDKLRLCNMVDIHVNELVDKKLKSVAKKTATKKTSTKKTAKTSDDSVPIEAYVPPDSPPF